MKNPWTRRKNRAQPFFWLITLYFGGLAGLWLVTGSLRWLLRSLL